MNQNNKKIQYSPALEENNIIQKSVEGTYNQKQVISSPEQINFDKNNLENYESNQNINKNNVNISESELESY